MPRTSAEQLAVKRERRTAWIASQGGKCVQCGATDSLEIDHLERASKEYEADYLWSLHPDNPLVTTELAKCQLLCRKCHRSKTNLEMQTAEHGTLSKYQGGCRCIPCTEANAERQRIYWRERGRSAFKPTEHGKPGMYNTRKCKCDACRAAKKAYAEAYRARKAQGENS